VTQIHLLGSEGFIGKALKHEDQDGRLHCWSHRDPRPDHHFDLLDQTTWERLLFFRPRAVILLSWPGLPNYQELFHITRNLPACIELIDRLSAAGLKRIVVSGTCYEYGLQNGALREDLITDPRNCYAIAKDTLRRVIESRFKNESLQWCWARIFYPYGSEQNSNALLPALYQAMQRQDASFPMTSGRQIRDYISVKQVAKILLH